MRCAACGSDNRDDRRYCRQCGSSLAAECPACGAANDPGDRFCGACGEALAATPAVPAPARREGSERRMLSILFADLVGFTPLSESRDPEEVRELLGRYFETTRAIVERYGGTLEKFIGDAVVAVWGAPLAQEDDAERAVRTALELVTAVDELGKADHVPLALRVGVSTGNAAVTLGAIGQGMVAGDVVNTTARIQTAAEPGTVLVDEATRRATEAAIAHAPAGSFELKGKSAPVELWRAQRVVAARRGEGRSLGVEPPFVGRARELSLLKQLLHSTADGSRAHVVAVSGIGGIGKSRLAWEFEKYVDGLAGDFLWHRGRCLAYGDGVAFWALAEILRMRCRILEEEGDETARSKLESALAEFLEPDDRELVRSPLRQLLGIESQRDGDRNRLFPAWRLFIERMADTAPVVLVFEDIQWADGALLEFIDYLMEWSRNHPLFVLTLSRPDVTSPRPAPSARAMTALGLEPLSRDEMTELVRGLTPGVPDELAARIVDAAEGVPLYAVETVRMLLDRGYLTREGDGLVVSADLGTLEVPETLHALVAARLDALPDPQRRLIEDAAVLGKTFTLTGLAAVSGTTEAELEPLLASLVRREVLVLQTDPRSPERGQYAFVQAIVRTIAYETIGRRERKRRHLASARHLESIGGDELTEVIAAHYVDAHRLAPDDEDAGEIRDQAVRTLLRAAERANSLAAPGEAARLVTSAIEMAEDDVERAGLLEEAGRLVLADGGADESIKLFAASAEAFERAGDQHAAARLNARRSEALFLNDRLDEAMALMEPAYAQLRDREQDADLAALAAQFGRMLSFADRVEESGEPLERALEISERQQLWGTLSHAMNTKGLNGLIVARFQEGTALLTGALRVAIDHDEYDAALRAHFNLAFSGELVDVLNNGHDEAGLALARRLGDRNWERAFLMHSASTAFLEGAWDDALPLARLATEESGDQFSRAALAWPVATILAYRGDAEAAAASMQRSGMSRDSLDAQVRVGLAAADSMRLMAGERWAEAAEAAAGWESGGRAMGLHHPSSKIAYCNWAVSSFRHGDTESARLFVERIASLPPGQLTPVYEAQLGRMRALLGACDDAAAEMAAAADTLRRIRFRFLLMMVQVDAAELLATTHPQQAAEALAEAGDLATSMGAAVISDRLSAIAVPRAAAGA